MAQIMWGDPVARLLDERTMHAVRRLEAADVVPCLALVSAGMREDCRAYIRGLRRRCAHLGIAVREIVLPAGVSQERACLAVAELNSDEKVHGIILCQPFDCSGDFKAVAETIVPSKDVDGVTSASAARVCGASQEGFLPAAPEACLVMLDFYGVKTEGARMVVIGDSPTVGRPLWLMLSRYGSATCCNIFTKDVPSITRKADLVVSATGAIDQFGPEYFSEGQVVVDVGIGISERTGRLSGDVRFDEVEKMVRAITPVPGGVGAVTASVTASHVVEAALQMAGAPVQDEAEPSDAMTS